MTMKKALVTGGSGDIGKSICLALAKDNLHVYVHSNSNPDKAKKVVDQIKASGGSAESVCFDVSDRAQCEATLAKLVESDPIQVLVNNAGVHDDAVMAGMTYEQWQKVIDINLNGFFNVTQPILLAMLRSRWGRIVSMSSLAGVVGNRGQANYSASKAGIQAASKSLSLECASRGVTVNCIAPGVIAGEMSEQAFDENFIKNMIPMRRAGKPEEVAALVRFLCSEDAGYISGQTINVNGAMI